MRSDGNDNKDNNDKKIEKRPPFKRADASAKLDVPKKSVSNKIETPKIKPEKKTESVANIFHPSDHPLDYYNLAKNGGRGSFNNYKAYSMSGYIRLDRNDNVPIVSPRIKGADIKQRMMTFQANWKQQASPHTGWKLHISVEPESIDKTWSLIHPILTKHGITGIKIPSIHAIETRNPDATATKQFTIYLFRNENVSNETLAAMIREIDETLTGAKLQPGNLPVANKKIEGSAYCSYRNDTSPGKDPADNDAYLSDADADRLVQLAKKNNLPGADSMEAYNPSGVNDRLKDLKPYAKVSPRA